MPTAKKTRATKTPSKLPATVAKANIARAKAILEKPELLPTLLASPAARSCRKGDNRLEDIFTDSDWRTFEKLASSRTSITNIAGLMDISSPKLRDAMSRGVDDESHGRVTPAALLVRSYNRGRALFEHTLTVIAMNAAHDNGDYRAALALLTRAKENEWEDESIDAAKATAATVSVTTKLNRLFVSIQRNGGEGGDDVAVAAA